MISLARSAELVTVACGSRCRISFWTTPTPAALAAATYTVLISFFIDLPVPGSVASAWARASGIYTLAGCRPAAG